MAKQICITMLTLMFDKSMDCFFPHYILRLQWSHQENLGGIPARVTTITCYGQQLKLVYWFIGLSA